MSSENDTSTTLDTALRFDAIDLVGRTGSHRRIERTVPAPARELGGVAMQVPEGQDIAVEAELESVVEGIYVHGTATARLEGECSRCLDAVEQDVSARLDELFMVPRKVRAEEQEDTALLTDDEVHLGPLVRDALAMEAEERPLCREDCPGLCGECGARMEEQPDHHHDVIDARFAALKGLFERDDAGTPDKDGAASDDGDATSDDDATDVRKIGGV